MLNTIAGKEERGTDACIPAKERGEGLCVTPIGWEKTREILIEKFNNREHWVLIVHALKARLIVEIEERYYAGEKNQGLTLTVAFQTGQPFSLVAARKRHMRGYQLASLLRQVAGYHTSERELLARDLLIVAPDALMGAATELANTLLTRGDLAMEA
jgi:hypothetical protein